MPECHGGHHPDTRYEHGFGAPFGIAWVHRSCPDGYQGDLPWQLGHGFMSQAHPWDPEGEGITGSETVEHPGVTIRYDWSLSRS